MVVEYVEHCNCGGTVIMEDEIWGRSMRTTFMHLVDGDPTKPCGGLEKLYADNPIGWITFCEVATCKKQTSGVEVPSSDGWPFGALLKWWCEEHQHLKPQPQPKTKTSWFEEL